MPADLPALDPAAVHASATGVSTKREWRDYTVRPGDTLYDIAAAQGTTVRELATHNNLSHGGRWIQAGAIIEVPASPQSKAAATSTSSTSSSSSSSGSSSSTATNSGNSTSSSAGTVMVRPGDTLWHIAARHNVTVAALAKANDLSTAQFIYPGQELTIPGASGSSERRTSEPASRSSSGSQTGSEASTSQTTTQTSTAGTVTVRPGDTLSHIAARHKVSLADLQKANPGINARFLQVGTQITIPGSGATDAKDTAPATPSGPYTPQNIGDAHKGEQVETTFLHYTYDNSVARSAQANREYLASVPVPNREEVRQMIVETSRAHGVDEKLMLALANMESGYNHRAVSPANAIGIMQVIPSSGQWASDLVGRELNLLDPQDNVTAGVVIMRALLRAADDERQAIGGYYQGLAGVQANGMYSDTRHYVDTIQVLRKRM